VNDPILIINLWEPWIDCHRCGKPAPCKWGLPVGEDGSYVPTWFQGEWGGVPACKECYEWHQKASERIKPSNTPLI
jgi:hypothetical protein